MGVIPEYAFQEALSILLKHACSESEKDITEQESSQFAHIKQFDENASQLEDVLSQLNAHVPRQVAFIRQRRNLLTTIHTLPAELLVKVFSFVIDSDPLSRDSLRKIIASVSSTWFAAVLSAPTLWTHLSTTSNIDLNRHAIARSRQAILHIDCHSAASFVDEQKFFQMLVPHISRWHTLQSNSPHTAAIVADVLQTGHPCRLETFEIHSGLFEPWQEVPLPIQNDASSLKRLALRAFSFPLQSPILSTLETITFSPYTKNGAFTSDEWYTFLSNVMDLPNLEDLEIFGRGSAEDAALDIPKVTMPHRKVIKLLELSPLLIGALLQAILPAPGTCPLISIINPLGYRVSSDKDRFLAMFPETSPPGSLLATIRSGRRFEVSWESRRLSTVWTGGNAELSLSLYLVSEHFISSNLSVLIPPHSRPTIKDITFSGEALFSTDILADVGSFTNLDRLTLRKIGFEPFSWDTDTRLEDICESLLPSSSSNEAGEAELWPCPKLRYLRIEDFNDLLPIWELIQRRYGSSTERSSALPVSLEELYLIQSRTPSFAIDPSLVLQLGELPTVQNFTLATNVHG